MACRSPSRGPGVQIPERLTLVARRLRHATRAQHRHRGLALALARIVEQIAPCRDGSRAAASAAGAAARLRSAPAAARPACSTTTCWRCPGARPTAPSAGDERDDPQCDRAAGGPTPSCCTACGRSTSAAGRRTAAAPTAAACPGPVADRMLDIMPSKRLVFHEYRKHGTCSGLGVDGYFDLARQLYEKVKIPPRFVGLTDDAHDGQRRRADRAISWPPTPASSPT